MLAITCDKCRRRYTATDEELQVYVNESEGKKFAQVLCPHCGKPSKIAADRIQQALRFGAPRPAAAADETQTAVEPAEDASAAADGASGAE